MQICVIPPLTSRAARHLAQPFGRSKKSIPSVSKLPQSAAVEYPTLFAYKGLQWSGSMALRPGAFLAAANSSSLMQLDGIYELQHQSKDDKKNMFLLSYFSWLPDETDTLDRAYRLPLYQKQPQLMWITLADLANAVRAKLHDNLWQFFLCMSDRPCPLLCYPLPAHHLTVAEPVLGTHYSRLGYPPSVWCWPQLPPQERVDQALPTPARHCATRCCCRRGRAKRKCSPFNLSEVSCTFACATAHLSGPSARSASRRVA